MAKWTRLCAIALQLLIYLCNAFIWAVSILAVICGFVIGIANDTIRINKPGDLGVTTPATILIIYGFLLIIVTTVGCFSSVTAGKYISLVYIVLILLYICFDAFGGYLFLFSDDAFIKYYKTVNASLESYGDSSAKGIGFFSISPEEYWNFLQIRGKCCGFVSLDDWRRTQFSRKTFNIPDSCCNEEYSYRYCGLLVIHHPDTDYHSVDHMVNSMGCNDIFPEPMRYPPEDSLSYIGIFVGAGILFCCVLTIVILIMVFANVFRKDQGIDNLDYVEDPKEDENREGMVMNGGGEQQGRITPARNRSKVHPATIKGEDMDSNSNKRVIFKESGPQFIRENNPPPQPYPSVISSEGP